MKNLKFDITISFLLSIIFLFTGCVTVQETLYLRQAEVTGPIVPSPIHITDSTDTPSVTFSPKFTYNTTNSLTGEIAQLGSYYDIDTLFTPSEYSLRWDMATFHAGLDMDIAFSNVFAISMGINYSSQNNFNGFGGNFGIGFFGYNKGSAFRFDMGLQIQSMQYDAFTVVIRRVSSHSGTSESTSFYHDIGKSTHYDPYFNFTYNTAFKDWPLNLFISAGYSFQTMFSFEPRTAYLGFGSTSTDNRGSSTAGFINFTPGIYFNIDESKRILLAPRFFIEMQTTEANPQFFIFPMMQFDFVL